jgi:hypothetical protein
VRPDDELTPTRRSEELTTPKTDGNREPSEVDSLREEIERTRDDMTETVEAIERKLNPEQLTDQAKEVADYAVRQATEQVKEAAKEITDHAIDKAKSAVHEITGQARSSVRAATIGKVERMVYDTQDRMNEAQTSIVDLVKANPVASALVGIGLGWLFLNRDANRDVNGPRRRSASGQWQSPGSRTWSQGSPADEQHAGLQRTFEDGEAAMRGAIDRAQETAEDVAERVQDAAYSAQGTATDIGAGLMNIIRQNPVPSALAGLSIGYLLMNGSGATQSPTAYRAVGQVRGTTERVAGEVQGTAEEIAGRVQSTASQVTDRVQQAAGDIGSDLDYQALRTRMRLDEIVNDNPLLVGAAAFVLGAAIGLPVPQTQQESSLMGSASSQVIERAQTAAQEAVRKVQHVAEQATSTAEREAKNQGLAS